MKDVTAAATLFAWLDREVWVVTAQDGKRRGGLVATFVSQASIVADMPRVLVGLSRQHSTCELIEASGCFVLHLLAEENLEMVWKFGLETGRDHDKFADMAVETSSLGCPLLASTVGWLECRVETSVNVGDRTLFLAEVLEGRVTNFAPPLTSRRLMELAPASRLTQMQRQRNHEAYRDMDAILAWREGRDTPEKGSG